MTPEEFDVMCRRRGGRQYVPPPAYKPTDNTPSSDGGEWSVGKYILLAIGAAAPVWLAVFLVSIPQPPATRAGPKPATVNLNDSHALNDAYGIKAFFSCASQADDYLRQASKWSFKWDEVGWLDRKFDNYLATVTAPGVLTMTSNKVSLQNEFGAYRRMTLLCSYDTKADKVLEYAITD